MPGDLVARAIAGDRDAFTELARRSLASLYPIARLILRDTERAEDATQEALVAAWRDLSALRDPERFDAWLRRLLVRACYREARRERRIRVTTARVRPIATASSDEADAIADRQQLGQAIERLDPEQRAVLVLAYYVGLEPLEIAAALGVPHGTVKSRLHRAKQSLRATLDAETRLAPLPAGRIS